jgi:hypothetical protein
MFIPDPVLDILPIPDPEVKKAPDPGFGSVTMLSPMLKIRSTPSFILSKRCAVLFSTDNNGKM